MRSSVVALLVLVLCGLFVQPARAEDDRIADLNLRLWPTPSTAARGEIIRYDISVDNKGDGKASRTRVTLPFPKDQLSFVKVELAQKSSWVMELSDQQIVIMFGTLRRGDTRTARIFFTIGKTATDGAVLRLRASLRYDEDSGDRLRSNETTFTVKGVTADPKPNVVVEPSQGAAGTIFRFTVRNFYPEEKVFTWINAPEAVLPSGLNGITSEQGEAQFDLNSAKLKLGPGKYSLVALGGSSKVTIVTQFEIK